MKISDSTIGTTCAPEVTISWNCYPKHKTYYAYVHLIFDIINDLLKARQEVEPIFMNSLCEGDTLEVIEYIVLGDRQNKKTWRYWAMEVEGNFLTFKDAMNWQNELIHKLNHTLTKAEFTIKFAGPQESKLVFKVIKDIFRDEEKENE